MTTDDAAEITASAERARGELAWLIFASRQDKDARRAVLAELLDLAECAVASARTVRPSKARRDRGQAGPRPHFARDAVPADQP